MFIFIGLFALLCLWNIKLKPDGDKLYMTDYMSVDKTTAIKGIFILMVFFSHFNSYVDYTSDLDLLYYDGFKEIGQRMVTLFMLYSGYGVMESIKKKKMTYVHNIPKTRVIGTYFKFIIAVIVFLIMHFCLDGFEMTYSIKKILLAFTAWVSVGNSNWYIFAIAVCYILTFISFELFRDKANYIPSAIVLTVLVAAYICLFHFYELRPSRFYNTVICYVIGVYLSIFKDKFDKLFTKNDTIWSIAFSVCWILTIALWDKSDRFYIYEICMITFAFGTLLLTMKVSIYNKILHWFGQHLFSVFIFQRIPMIVFKELGLADKNIYIYFILCLIVTVALAYVFDKLVDPLWKFISTPRKKLNKA